MRVVYNGCDTTVFRPSADRVALALQLGWPRSLKTLLFCGHVTEVKGMTELATAWSSFASRHLDWRLLVVGQRVDRALSARMAALPRVELTGALTPRQVVRYLQAADAYVQPSRNEGLSNATMEAMATGLPVIATATGSQGELIVGGENGWMVPPRDPDALESALEDLAQRGDERWTLGHRARSTIEERFDPRQQAATLAEILQGAAVGG
jgi:glycosyltransferase involved in cell wall biosynthesis